MNRLTELLSPGARFVRVALFVGATALASSCGGSGGDRSPTQPAPEQPQPPAQPAAAGTLTARLVTPNADDGAVLVEISGPAPAADVATPVQGAVVHSRTSGNTVRAAVFGSISTGALVQFSVPDVNAASQYSARVTEASDRTNALRTSLTGYAVSIGP